MKKFLHLQMKEEGKLARLRDENLLYVHYFFLLCCKDVLYGFLSRWKEKHSTRNVIYSFYNFTTTTETSISLDKKMTEEAWKEGERERAKLCHQTQIFHNKKKAKRSIKDFAQFLQQQQQ